MKTVLALGLSLTLLATLGAGQPAQPPAASQSRAAPLAAGSGPNGCVGDWFVSYGGTSSFYQVHTDPDDLPITDLVFSRSYNDPTDLSRGYLDFARSGQSDVFSAVPIGGGLYRWRYVQPGPGVTSTVWSDWINLAYDSTPPDQLRFGDFNGDGYTDVFSAAPLGGGSYQWRYSPGGTASYQNLATDTIPPDELRFGDFNGDGRTDVFALTSNGTDLSWDVSYSGTANYVQINHQPTALSEMQFGDVNGDGHTDVFTSQADAGGFDWLVAYSGSGPYQVIASLRPQSVHGLLLAGNFNLSAPDIALYHGTDVFYTQPRQDGALQWWYYYFKPSPLALGDTPLAYAATPPEQLRFGDFNGDGVTDVFKLVQNCPIDLPLLER